MKGYKYSEIFTIPLLATACYGQIGLAALLPGLFSEAELLDFYIEIFGGLLGETTAFPSGARGQGTSASYLETFFSSCSTLLSNSVTFSFILSMRARLAS